MRYLSTRDKNVRLTAAQAIAQGLASDGGLFVPEVIPSISKEQLSSICEMRYAQRAQYVMSLFLKDFTNFELSDFTERAYNTTGFDTAEIAPVHQLEANTWFLELWHGPTSAFKDMALQMLPHLLQASLEKTGESKQVVILVATSGDTGKAALEGFCDVDKTKILVFYPKDGVSEVQELQMTTQKGENVCVCAVRGNFDDAQTGVKEIFSDKDFAKLLGDRGYFLSSANSINWGRLLPQIVYYFSAYCDLITAGRITPGDKVNFAVPTGNFGNILAGYYAKLMGLPVGKLICASNANNVLTDFIQTGTYDRNRAFHTTLSPSMDILVSSNLERLLFSLSGEDDVEIKGYFDALAKTGQYTVSPAIQEKVRQFFWAGFADDARTKAQIKQTYTEENYLMDTHTAVAQAVLEDYRRETGDDTVTVVVSTASPYKFADSVIESLGESQVEEGLAVLAQLSELTNTPIPAPLAGLAGQAPRFEQVLERGGLKGAVEEFLGL